MAPARCRPSRCSRGRGHLAALERTAANRLLRTLVHETIEDPCECLRLLLQRPLRLPLSRRDGGRVLRQGVVVEPRMREEPAALLVLGVELLLGRAVLVVVLLEHRVVRRDRQDVVLQRLKRRVRAQAPVGVASHLRRERRGAVGLVLVAPAEEEVLQLRALELVAFDHFAIHDCLEQPLLRHLLVEYAVLHRPRAHEAVHEDGARLPVAVRAADGLAIVGRVPRAVEDDDARGGGEGEADAAGLGREQEDGVLLLRLRVHRDLFLAVVILVVGTTGRRRLRALPLERLDLLSPRSAGAAAVDAKVAAEGAVPRHLSHVVEQVLDEVQQHGGHAEQEHLLAEAQDAVAHDLKCQLHLRAVVGLWLVPPRRLAQLREARVRGLVGGLRGGHFASLVARLLRVLVLVFRGTRALLPPAIHVVVG
mmetsp:Transcript_13738/g.42762  ORF Transcript_13738/g.42762 Transcript_13738/m.42762 type:complete len:422 (+) Transcript_13738:365-1630(+)